MKKPQPTIIEETADWLVINKPAGFDSQDSKPDRPSIVDWLENRYKFRGLIHRLDFGTSGAMICAKNSGAAKVLTDLMANGKITRKYLAVVLGQPPASGKWDAALEGKPAITHFLLKEQFRTTALTEVELETGRKHQIRQHFAQAGMPILGDHLYGNQSAKLLFKRPALHAHELRVQFEESEKIFKAEPPEDFESLLQRLRQ